MTDSNLHSEPKHDIYPFAKPQQSARFQHLLGDLRCLVCQNESLLDSNAGLAKDLRGEVYKMVKQGQSDTSIKHYLTQRYGDFVLFKPAVDVKTYGLWLAPVVLLMIGALVFRKVIRK